MRRSAWVGTIALHAMVIAAVARCVPERAVPEAITAAVEIVRPEPEPEPEPEPDSSSLPRALASPRAGSAPARRSGGGKRGPKGPVVAHVESEIRSGGGGARGDGEESGSGSGSGSGSEGLGAARGAETSEVPAPPTIPVEPPKPRSKARPPKLIWPVRHRAETEGDVFVVRLKISADGYVTGVRMVKGTTRHANARAEEGAWRFRYDPARDFDGNPIASEVEQKLMIE